MISTPAQHFVQGCNLQDARKCTVLTSASQLRHSLKADARHGAHMHIAYMYVRSLTRKKVTRQAPQDSALQGFSAVSLCCIAVDIRWPTKVCAHYQSYIYVYTGISETSEICIGSTVMYIGSFCRPHQHLLLLCSRRCVLLVWPAQSHMSAHCPHAYQGEQTSPCPS